MSHEFDYGKAASFWDEKDASASHLPEDQLKDRIDGFIGRHNTAAFACGAGDYVRCTPMEYNYVDGHFYFFSEGGHKYRALKENANVSLAIFDEYVPGGALHGAQVTGTAVMIEPWSDEYTRLVEYKHIPVEAMKKMDPPMPLIRVDVTGIDYLDSSLKAEGYSSRQTLAR